MTTESNISTFELSIEDWETHLKKIPDGNEQLNKIVKEYIKQQTGTNYKYSDNVDKEFKYQEEYLDELYTVIDTDPKNNPEYILKYFISNITLMIVKKMIDNHNKT
ncbi:MAG: hypothetical protein Edafosvirus4_61 [Edafosvirus sp.]|uniref:Uncharacterized protein n=1 Tax=Edafosvirus sp. TaxID=2487765 RepID=A0A3G4ZT70_9VIRU|nr:MAG: hypothetical protein Edafosvirus4_61 [Edafosvirus sp.]